LRVEIFAPSERAQEAVAHGIIGAGDFNDFFRFFRKMHL
jgi:hypothetical protein